MTEQPNQDRRAFLRRVALTTLYAAPVIRELAAPRDLAAQGQPGGEEGFATEKGNQGGGGGTGGGGGGGGGKGGGTAESIGNSFVAPWQME